MGHTDSKIAGVELDDETVERLTKTYKLYSRTSSTMASKHFYEIVLVEKLTSRQFTEVYKKFYPEFEADKYSSQVFRTFDVDNNGYIDFVEFLLAVNVNSNGEYA